MVGQRRHDAPRENRRGYRRVGVSRKVRNIDRIDQF
jgi:hypothetical protein